MPFVIADVLFPAFYFPYFAQVTYPLAAVAALLAEGLVFALLNRQHRRSHLLGVVVVANLTSSLAGIALAEFLSSGLHYGFTRSPDATQGGRWTALTAATWLVAFAVSIVLEYVVVRAVTRRTPFQQPALTVIAANIVSYVVLLAVLQASLSWSLHQRTVSRAERWSLTPVCSGLPALATDARLQAVLPSDHPRFTCGTKTALAMPDPVFKAADTPAHRLGMSRSSLHAEALHRRLQLHDEHAVTSKLNEVLA
ncbi:hypothetical protein EG835_09485, partial [bacterium]|nr:hypothetical protein [bacterium]